MRLIQHYPDYYRQKLERYIEAYTEPDPYFNVGHEIAIRKCGDEFILYLTSSGKSTMTSFQAIVSFEENYTDVLFQKEPTQKKMQIMLAILGACIAIFISFYNRNYGFLAIFCVMLVILSIVEHFEKKKMETVILNFLNRN